MKTNRAPQKQISLPLALACLWALVSAACLSTRADTGDSVANVKDPCTPHESWEYSPAVPQAWQDRFSNAIPGAKGVAYNLIVFASAQYFRDAMKRKDFQALGDYQMARAYFRLGLPELAFGKFNEVLREDTRGADGLKLAALQCLNRIRERSPSLVLPPESVQWLLKAPIASMSGEQRAMFLDMIVSFSEKEIAGDAPQGRQALPEALALLKGSGPYESYVLALQAAKDGKMDEAVSDGEKFLSYDKRGEGLPDALKDRANALRLLLGEVYYGERKYDAAASVFRDVTSDSNDLAQSLTGLAWSHLLVKRYGDAMGAARNLLMGGLKRTFEPEANLVSAMAFLETCHYTEALKSVKMLQRNYWGAYNWLYRWHKRPGNETPYQMLARDLEKKEKLPVRVAAEWSRSPIFIQSQEELNAVYDERDAMKSLLPRAERFKKTHRGIARALTTLIAGVKAESQHNRDREQALVAAINSDLSQRGLAMLVNIADAWGNSQLIEVDTYNQIGDKMMADHFSANYRKMAENRKMHRDDGPVWDGESPGHGPGFRGNLGGRSGVPPGGLG